MTSGDNSNDHATTQPHSNFKRIWMPFYIDDFLADTLDLDTDQVGAYFLLIMLAWKRNGPIPNDMTWLKKSLKRLTSDMHGLRFNRLIPPLLKRYFQLGEDGNWRNKRVENELRIARECSENARRKAKERWSKSKEINNLANAKAMQTQYNTIQYKKEDILEAPQPASVPETRKPSNRGSRLPEGWNPSVESHTYAVGLLGADGSARELDKFRDYWMSLPGQRGVKLDWNRTWRNWCRTALERRGSYNGHGGPRPLQDDSLSASRAAARLAEAAERGEFEFAPRPKPPSSEGSRHIRLLSKG